MYDHQRTVRVFLDAIAHLPDSCEYVIDTRDWIGTRGFVIDVRQEFNCVQVIVRFSNNHAYAENQLGKIRAFLKDVNKDLPLRINNGTFDSICGGEKFVFLFFQPEYSIFWFSPKWIPTFEEVYNETKHVHFMERLSDFEDMEKIPDHLRAPQDEAVMRAREAEKKKKNEKRAARRKELRQKVLDATAPKGIPKPKSKAKR